MANGRCAPAVAERRSCRTRMRSSKIGQASTSTLHFPHLSHTTQGRAREPCIFLPCSMFTRFLPSHPTRTHTPANSSRGRRAHAPLPSECPEGFKGGVGRARGWIKVARGDTRHSALGLCRVERRDVVQCGREWQVRESDIGLWGGWDGWVVAVGLGSRRARGGTGKITWSAGG